MRVAEIGDLKLEPRPDLSVGVLGETDRARLGDAFEPCGNINTVAHEIAVRFLDDIADVDADAKFDTAIRRQARVSLDHAVLNFDRTAHRVHHAAEFDDRAVAGALHDAAVVGGDRRVDQVATQTLEGATSVRSSSAPASRL